MKHQRNLSRNEHIVKSLVSGHCDGRCDTEFYFSYFDSRAFMLNEGLVASWPAGIKLNPTLDSDGCFSCCESCSILCENCSMYRDCDGLSSDDEEPKVMAPKEIQFDIYTDGSHSGDKGAAKHDASNKAKRHVGIGIWCRFGDKDYSYSSECTLENCSKFGFTADEVEVISNPTAEFIGLAEAMRIMLPQASAYVRLGSKVTLKFLCDYKGVFEWMKGNWRAKKSYIKKILDYCRKLMSKYQVLIDQGMIVIEYEHVPGHSGIKGNEEADRLAKMRDPLDTFNFIRFV